MGRGREEWDFVGRDRGDAKREVCFRHDAHGLANLQGLPEKRDDFFVVCGSWASRMYIECEARCGFGSLVHVVGMETGCTSKATTLYIYGVEGKNALPHVYTSKASNITGLYQGRRRSRKTIHYQRQSTVHQLLPSRLSLRLPTCNIRAYRLQALTLPIVILSVIPHSSLLPHIQHPALSS